MCQEGKKRGDPLASYLDLRDTFSPLKVGTTSLLESQTTYMVAIGQQLYLPRLQKVRFENSSLLITSAQRYLINHVLD